MVSKLKALLYADELDVKISGYLLDQPFDNRTHDFGFLHADLEDLLMRNNRLR